MKGYVKNIGKAPIYIFKGVVNSDETIVFDVLLKRFGDVADTSSELAFADWLSKNKFVDKSKWQVVTKKITKKNINKSEIKETSATELPLDETKVEPENIETVSKTTATNKEIIRQSVAGVKKEMTIDYIVDIKILNMKREVGRIDDLKLLKMALKKAEGMTKKATLCNALRDRITELSVR